MATWPVYFGSLSHNSPVMKFGFVLPKGNARTAANLAVILEHAGWEGLFLWEPIYGSDAWVSLTAAAMVTTKIKLGTVITPISRMRPWDLAGKAATLSECSEDVDPRKSWKGVRGWHGAADQGA